jgi:hypothetical protein
LRLSNNAPDFTPTMFQQARNRTADESVPSSDKYGWLMVDIPRARTAVHRLYFRVAFHA